MSQKKKKKQYKGTKLCTIFHLARACSCSQTENRTAGSGAVFGRRLYNEIISSSKSDTFGTSFTNTEAVSHFAARIRASFGVKWAAVTKSADLVGLKIRLKLCNQTQANAHFLPVTSWTHKEKEKKKKSDTMWNVVHGRGKEAINFVAKVNGISSS